MKTALILLLLALVGSSMAAKCWPWQFECDNGNCIPAGARCNYYDNCGDMSDEMSCKCGDQDFVCDNTRCVPEYTVCDNDNNCGDGSDETEEACPCDEGVGRCPRFPPDSPLPGTCLPPEFICDEDGIWDCMDGSDEANCTNVVRKPRHA